MTDSPVDEQVPRNGCEVSSPDLRAEDNFNRINCLSLDPCIKLESLPPSLIWVKILKIPLCAVLLSRLTVLESVSCFLAKRNPSQLKDSYSGYPQPSPGEWRAGRYYVYYKSGCSASRWEILVIYTREPCSICYLGCCREGHPYISVSHQTWREHYVL